MPELPEVETTKRQITPFLADAVISRVLVRNGSLRAPVSLFLYQLRDEPIIAVTRRAKYLLLQLKSGFIVIHLGMTGYLRLCSAATPPTKHDHIDLLLTNGLILRYHDVRRFGLWEWVRDPEHYSRFQNLGPEPLSEAFSGDYLWRAARGKTRALKALLMDGEAVVGVGNIYANEALFAARLHPAKPAGRLTKKEAVSLVAAIKTILGEAIIAGGTTISDFRRPDGKTGYFVQELKIYGKAGMPCPSCGTPISVMKIAGRASFYCPVCQKIPPRRALKKRIASPELKNKEVGR